MTDILAMATDGVLTDGVPGTGGGETVIVSGFTVSIENVAVGSAFQRPISLAIARKEITVGLPPQKHVFFREG